MHADSFFDLSPDLLCAVDVAGNITRVNPAFTAALGWTAGAIVSRPYLDLVHADDRLRAVPTLSGQVGRSDPPLCEYRLRCADGTYRWVASQPSPIDVENGLTYVVARETTMIRQMTAEDAGDNYHDSMSGQAQKLDAVSRLASTVAHDFNNILTVIQGCSEFLRTSLPTDDPHRTDADMICEAASRGARLTGQLLAFSKNQSLEPTTVAVNDMIVDLQPTLGEMMGDGIEVRTDLAGDLRRVSVDGNRLESVIVAMAANARDAMQQRGQLLLATRNYVVSEADILLHPEATTGPYVRLSISDTGCGMDTATLSRVFEPFFTTKEPHGKGIALAAAYATIRQSSGFLAVSSTPQVGTVFDIFLPAIDGEVSEKQRTDTVAGLRGRETILIVEDDPGVLAVASRMLINYGYAVIEAANGAEALSTVRGWGGNVDLVITDANMPVMNGGELADALAREYPRVRVLFMSLYTGDDIVRRGPDSRRAFMPKPFTAIDITRKVREVLDMDESSHPEENRP